MYMDSEREADFYASQFEEFEDLFNEVIAKCEDGDPFLGAEYLETIPYKDIRGDEWGVARDLRAYLYNETIPDARELNPHDVFADIY